MLVFTSCYVTCACFWHFVCFCGFALDLRVCVGGGMKKETETEPWPFFFTTRLHVFSHREKTLSLPVFNFVLYVVYDHFGVEILNRNNMCIDLFSSVFTFCDAVRLYYYFQSSYTTLLCHSLLRFRGGLKRIHILGFFLMAIFSQQEISHKSLFCSHWEKGREGERKRHKPHTHLQNPMPFTLRLGFAWICSVYIPMTFPSK